MPTRNASLLAAAIRMFRRITITSTERQADAMVQSAAANGP